MYRRTVQLGYRAWNYFVVFNVTNQNAKELTIKYFKQKHLIKTPHSIFLQSVILEFIQNSTSVRGSWCFRIYSFLNAGMMTLKDLEYDYRNAVLIMKKFCRDNPSERLGYQKVGQITFQITCHHLSPNLKPTPNIFPLFLKGPNHIDTNLIRQRHLLEIWRNQSIF